jgi:NAD(P)-dependent dehydrogenase (short-subunit alcohol dehydrogenase family)
MQIAGKVIVITGAASGVGAAAARRFAADGASVVLTDRDSVPLQDIASELGVASLAGDICDETKVRAVADLARQRHGRIDIWFSNAGWAGKAEPGSLQTNDSWQKAWNLHVMSHVYAARAVLPEMLARGEGYLLQTASAVALAMQPNNLRYTVTKHAALSLGEWLAANYRKKGIRVSCFCPGPMDTKMFRMSGLPADHPAVKRALSMEAVADILSRGIEAEKFLFDDTGPADGSSDFAFRGRDYDGWLGTMGAAVQAAAPGD